MKEKHVYQPSWMHQGDCVICGHIQGADIHKVADEKAFSCEYAGGCYSMLKGQCEYEHCEYRKKIAAKQEAKAAPAAISPTERPIKDLMAGEDFRNSLLARADSYHGPYPLWHGWVILEAFLAGIDYARKTKAGGR